MSVTVYGKCDYIKMSCILYIIIHWCSTVLVLIILIPIYTTSTSIYTFGIEFVEVLQLLGLGTGLDLINITWIACGIFWNLNE